MTVFTWVRLKLTGLYLAIIMLITVAFSLGMYSILVREVERFGRMQRIRIEDRMLPGRSTVIMVDPDLVNEARTRIASTLIYIDLAIFITSGVLGYFLAGRTLQPIKEMVDEQNRFISDASHEFRTPLTALKSSFEVFLREKGAKLADAKELIRDGINDVDKLNSLATSLLELAQFEKSRQKLDFKVVELDTVIEETIDTVKPLAVKESIKIDYPESHLKVMGNVDKLAQLFTILLDNAVKYSKEGGEVNIRASNVEGKLIQVKIVDYGMGIASEDLTHIFDRFYRADSSRTKSGYGLGLSIAKSIVDTHAGKILVTSELGKGTTVQVIFRMVE